MNTTTTTPNTTDEAIVAGIYASPDFVVFETREEIAAFFEEDEVQEDAAPVAGDKITYTGEIVFAESNWNFFGGTRKRSMFVIVRDDNGTSYKFTSAADFAKHIRGGSAGILSRGNRVTFTATVKRVGEYKGTPSIDVTRPRMVENDYAGFFGMPIDELPV